MASSLAYLNSKADNGRENAVDSGVWSAQVLKDGPSLDVCWQMVDHQHQQRRTQKMQRFFHLGRHLLIKHLPRDVTELVRSSKRALFITLNLSACLTLTSRHIFHHQISTLLFNPLQPPIQPLPAFAPPSPGFSPGLSPGFSPAFRPAFRPAFSPGFSRFHLEIEILQKASRNLDTFVCVCVCVFVLFLCFPLEARGKKKQSNQLKHVEWSRELQEKESQRIR